MQLNEITFMKISKREIIRNCNFFERMSSGDDLSLNREKLIELLASSTTARPPVGRESRKLLHSMQSNKWEYRRRPHRGVFGDSHRSPDQSLHATLSIKNRTYHLKFRSSMGRLEIFEIT